jgi:hypothetical protein
MSSILFLSGLLQTLFFVFSFPMFNISILSFSISFRSLVTWSPSIFPSCCYVITLRICSFLFALCFVLWSMLNESASQFLYSLRLFISFVSYHCGFRLGIRLRFLHSSMSKSEYDYFCWCWCVVRAWHFELWLRYHLVCRLTSLAWDEEHSAGRRYLPFFLFSSYDTYISSSSFVDGDCQGTNPDDLAPYLVSSFL